MRNLEPFVVVGFLILMLLLALNLIYGFRKELKRNAKYLAVMLISGMAAFFLAYAFKLYNGSLERPVMFAIGIFFLLGAYFCYREFFGTED